jgi:hypothetical protein
MPAMPLTPSAVWVPLLLLWASPQELSAGLVVDGSGERRAHGGVAAPLRDVRGKDGALPPPLTLRACVVPRNPAPTGVDRVMQHNICPLMLMRFTPMRGWCR